MARHTDAARGTWIEAGLVRLAGSALIAVFRHCVCRLFNTKPAPHSIARGPPPPLLGNLTLVRLLAAARILLFPERFYQLLLLGFLRSYFGHRQHPDKFFFLAHNYYLSKEFTLRQRVECAVSHYWHESRSCGPAYHLSVYRSSEGLILWHRVLNGTRYALILRATEDFRTEGDLSILCLVDGIRVCRLSFCYINGAVFGMDAQIGLFVTRNQTDRNAALEQFRADFKQNSPPYFCVAAVCGIAMAHGIRNICLIKDEAQIAYDPQYAQSFRNSYSAFWQVFGAKDMNTRHAFTMTVPPDFNPISTVKHKARASARRQNWLEIMVNARHAILENRLTRSPHPIDVETFALLSSAAYD